MRTAHGNAAWHALSDEPGVKLEDEREDLAVESKTTLRRSGFLTPDQVKAAMERSAQAALDKWRPPQLELDPVETSRAAIRSMRKCGCGRRGLPDEVVRRMYVDYLRGLSTRQVGLLYGRSGQTIWETFRRAGLEMREQRPSASSGIIWGGKRWTPVKGGYFRLSNTRKQPSKLLHVAMWEAWHSREKPDGHQVTFKDGDQFNFSRDNLVCLPIKEVTLLHYRRRFPERAGETLEQRRERWKAHYRELMRAKSAAFKAQGLRSDGKPLKRKVAA